MSETAVMKKETCGKSQLTDDERRRLVVVQWVKTRTEGTEDGVEVEGEGQDANGEDGLDIAVEDESSRHDNGQERLAQHNDRFPEHELLFVCSVEESGGLREPDVAGGCLDCETEG